MRFLVAGVVGAFLVASAAAAAPPIQAKLTTSTATPVVDQPWRWTVTVKSATGKPLPARLRLQILLGQTVVGCWKGGAMVQCFSQIAGDWIAFKGKRSGILEWPSQSRGAKLTFQATVNAAKQTRKLRVPVTVEPTS